ncbi:LAME_0C04808g1_1 [Lachancea meyersii CBS 8951]|uniref:Pre-mRNA-splicing factor CEF1 n=1 Tax=Lachancea meyersii CBS 8951 TaxID=1266667 RepID=A0A1G4J1D0_9SACH|nr:LAME_0C04808g1_1 [Lachancea meyersii CBS 8951]
MPPVPIYVKGGIWSNIEDQILKAAIEKYGTHQWSKIASLLQKKTARQCELRWNEYLNPSLNFTPFSKDEDAQLLDLVRRLPNQWRTISDAMGRTPQICVDRYNVLLQGTDSDVKLGTSLDLEVGDIDLNAESRPARPDPVDLESMDKEMLAEARARLLNTQGKKATRKIRERMLEESKRVAQLQKRRELKQAGIDSKIRAPRKKYSTEIDYNADVVYEREPESGPYDTTQEDERAARAIKNFEKSVERKGLRENERGAKAKRKRAQEENPSVVGQSSVLTDDFKKPKLSLPLESSIDSVRKTKTASKRSKRSILRLFESLPEPTNDFEIELEDEFDDNDDETNKGGSDEHVISETQGAIYEDSADGVKTSVDHSSRSSSKLDPYRFLKTTLPLPSLISAPSDLVEVEFNKLLTFAAASNSAPVENAVFESTKLKLELTLSGLIPTKDIQQRLNTEYAERVKKLLESATYSAGPNADKIIELKSRVHGLQKAVDEVEFFRNKNQVSNEMVFSDLLPKIVEFRHTYSLNYKKYQNEYYACQTRRQRLQEHLYEAGAEQRR